MQISKTLSILAEELISKTPNPIRAATQAVAFCLFAANKGSRYSRRLRCFPANESHGALVERPARNLFASGATWVRPPREHFAQFS